MLHLSIKDYVGENAITLSDGQMIFSKIYPLLKDNQAVTLDFDGMKIFASPFFNGAIGQLLKDISPDMLNKNLSIINIDPVWLDLARRVISNAKQYYSNPSIREAIDNSISQQSEDE